MSINEMDARAASYFELMAQIEELQAEAEAIKDEIKAAMQKYESIFRCILRIVGILALAAAGLLLFGWLFFRIFLVVTAPEREDFLQYHQAF